MDGAPNAILGLIPAYEAVLDGLPAGMVMYDKDLRIVVAEGELLRSTGHTAELVRGRLLHEVVSAEAFSVLAPRYRDALAGIERDHDYASPVGGRLYRTRGRTVRDDTGAVVGAVLLIWDVTAQGTLQSQVEQVQTLVGFGSAVFHRDSGWSIDTSLLALWGIADDTSPEQVVAELVVEDDRIRAGQAWADALRTGRLVNLEYRIRHGRTGELRHLHGAVQASTGSDGALLRAQTTQVDITDLVLSRQRAQAAEGRANQGRLVLTQVSALLATSPGGYGEAVQTTADLAAAAIGDGCTVRSFSDDGTLKILAVAHRTTEGRALLEAWSCTSATRVVDAGAAVKEVFTSHRPVHSVVVQGDPVNPPWSWGHKFLLAPAMYLGQARGAVSSFRDADGADYDDDDLDLLQAIADRFGSLLEAERARDEAQQLTAELKQINADQRELVLQLDRTEYLERGRLADAVHDEPLQLAVAALLRLDSYREQLDHADPSGPTIDHIASMLESCVGQLRSVLGTLTPPDLSRGLGGALRQLADGTFRGTDVDVRVCGPAHVPLDPNVKETVYRIVREALVNTRSHAHATTVRLDILDDDENIVLRLTDDGVGLGHAAGVAGQGASFGHLGMSSMRARAAAAGAVLTIQSPAAGGTVLELVVPVDIDRRTQLDADATASAPGGADTSGRPHELDGR